MYVIISKCKLLQFVIEGYVDGWDDLWMLMIVGVCCCGFMLESIYLFCEWIGVMKIDLWIDMSIFEGVLCDDFDDKVVCMVVVFDLLKFVIDNYLEDFEEVCMVFVYLYYLDCGVCMFLILCELWIECEDFVENLLKGYFCLFLGNKVCLCYGYVIECMGFDKDVDGNVMVVYCNYFLDSKLGIEGVNMYKVKGNIYWVSVKYVQLVEVWIYDCLFKELYLDVGGVNFFEVLNFDLKKIVQVYFELGNGDVVLEMCLQFECYGYFVVDCVDLKLGKLVFNWIVGLCDSWGKLV